MLRQAKGQHEQTSHAKKAASDSPVEEKLSSLFPQCAPGRSGLKFQGAEFYLNRKKKMHPSKQALVHPAASECSVFPLLGMSNKV